MVRMKFQPMFLKNWPHLLHLGLVLYSNSPMTQEQYPPDWTKAIHKKDSMSNPANHRPISLTSLCCKVMERIILSHIAKHLAPNNILIDQQHGFRQRFSCETQLFQQSMTVLNALTRAHKLT